MAKFAKLFNFDDDKQVLITKDYEPEASSYVIEITVCINGYFIYKTQDSNEQKLADHTFNTFDKQKAWDYLLLLEELSVDGDPDLN